MPEEIIIDGLEEHAFRRSIEAMLRNGRADEAVDRLKALLPEFAGEGKTLPGRLLEIGPEHINLAGWDRLAAKVQEYSRPSTPITAIGIGVGDPSDSGLRPDADGNLRPPLETSYYSDATFPFSETDRADLLEGYSAFGCEWQGDHDQIDDTLTIEGIDDLYGAIARLENDVASRDNPDPDDIRAGAVGACYLGVMVWQAARRAVIEQGLPRPMAILLVNSDAYPFFDAPVMTCDEYLDDGTLQVVTHESAASADDFEAEESEAASLIGIAGLGAHRGTTKKMALVLEGAEANNPLGMADDLVAQAAFDPSSVDISRFMPDASEFRNEPDDYENPHEEALEDNPHEEAAANPYEEKTANPYEETANSYEAELPNPYAEGPDESFEDITFPEDAAYAGEPAAISVTSPRTDALAGTRELEPFEEIDNETTVPSAYLAPDWAAPSDGRFPSVESSEPETRDAQDAPMPWLGHEADLPFASEPPPVHAAPQPASHSIRARVRVSAVEEDAWTGGGGFLASVGRFLKRVQELLLRR